jgi:Alpha-galactosidase, CBM13 domain
VQLRGITVDRLGSYTVKITYINPDATDRYGYLSVNGGTAIMLSLPPTGGSNSNNVAVAQVPLEAGAVGNTLTFTNPSGPGPTSTRSHPEPDRRPSLAADALLQKQGSFDVAERDHARRAGRAPSISSARLKSVDHRVGELPVSAVRELPARLLSMSSQSHIAILNRASTRPGCLCTGTTPCPHSFNCY